MTSEELQSLMRADPYVPFVLCTDHGDYQVASRELVAHAPGTNSAAVAMDDGSIEVIDLTTAYPMTTAELLKEEADDIAAGRDGLEEIRRGESVTWEQVKSELRL